MYRLGETHYRKHCERGKTPTTQKTIAHNTEDGIVYIRNLLLNAGGAHFVTIC